MECVCGDCGAGPVPLAMVAKNHAPILVPWLEIGGGRRNFEEQEQVQVQRPLSTKTDPTRAASGQVVRWGVFLLFYYGT